ncbi:recombinase family protein [Streptosporangium canum]|uniref:recombinase family protein n=1 Tax=Streptosporangium canum TaxID=324952 RepID=UPI0037AE76C3
MPPPHREPIDAIGYIRVSLLLEEQISPEIQRSAIADWARRTNRRIVRWIEDLDVSGRTFARRIMGGIEAIEAGEAREIVVWKYSRFGRSRTGCAVNLGRINRAGGELQSATEEVDASTATGKLTRGMLMELAAFESDRTGEQWAEAHAERLARGLPSHGRPRFGYELRGRVRDPLQKHRTIRAPEDGEERYEIDSVTGPILAELYHRYTAGSGGPTLAAWLNKAGILTNLGRTWSDGVLMRMLDTGFGAGLLRVHDPNCACTQPGVCKTKILIDGAHEAVITGEEWQAYRRRRLRVAALPPRARVTVYPLTGLIRCGHCNARMTITADGKTPGYWYKCGDYLRRGLCAPRSVQRSKAEAAVLANLEAWAEYIESKPVPESTRALEPAVDIGRLEAAIATADAAVKRLTLQVAKGLVSEDAYREAHAELVAERAASVAQLEVERQPQKREPYEYMPVVKTLLAEWETWPGAERREVLARVVSEVRVFRADRKTSWLEIETVWGEVRRADL